MNLYLLSQTETEGYDTFDACVVVAHNEDEARMIRPGWNTWNTAQQEDYEMEWARIPESVSVKFIGVTVQYSEPQVILASFRAG